MGRGRSSSSRGMSRGSSSSRGFSRSSSSTNRGSSRSSYGHSSSTGRWSVVRTNTTYHNSTSFGGGYHHTSPFSLNVVFAVLFFIFSIPFLIPSIFAVSDAMQYRSVKAVCIDNSYTSGWYYSIYDYTVQGKDYVSRSSEGWELPEEVGKTVKIYYSVSDPSEITENKPFTLGDVALVFLTLVFNGLGAMFVVFAVKIKKKEHSEVMSATSSSDNVSTTENDVKCMYCGSKYSKNLDACPKCGASRK